MDEPMTGRIIPPPTPHDSWVIVNVVPRPNATLYFLAILGIYFLAESLVFAVVNVLGGV